MITMDNNHTALSPPRNDNSIDALLASVCQWEADLPFLISPAYPEFEKNVVLASTTIFSSCNLFELISSNTVVKFKWYFDPRKYPSTKGFAADGSWDSLASDLNRASVLNGYQLIKTGNRGGDRRTVIMRCSRAIKFYSPNASQPKSDLRTTVIGNKSSGCILRIFVPREKIGAPVLPK